MWRLKILVKILLSRLPLGYSLWQKLGLFRHGQMDSIEYAIKVFESHILLANLVGNLNGKRILELGPGDSIATSLIAKGYGASSILVDAGDFMNKKTEIYKKFANHLSHNNCNIPDIANARNIDEILIETDSIFLSSGLSSLRSIPTDSIDFIFSQAVLEHLLKKEFLDIMIELRRILKPTGVSSHQVDLRDHLGGALNNLRFSEKVWESDYFVNSGFYTNRIRFYDMITLFKDAGFKVNITQINKWDTLPTKQKNMNSKYSKYSIDELNISTFDVILD